MSVIEPAHPIQVQRMPQLAEAVDADDNWTGVTDAAARRKRQNRLNVRAYPPKGRRKAQEARDSARHTTESKRTSSAFHSEPDDIIPCWVEDQQAVVRLRASAANPLRNLQKPLLSSSTTHSTQITSLSRPTPNRIILPLSSDHLIVLLQYNALRASLTNRALLDRLLLLNSSPSDATCTSILGPTTVVLPHPSTHSLLALPPALHPTALQSSVPHPPWIDIIPHPTIRDNLIRAAGLFDEDQLWSDNLGGLFEGFPDDHLTRYGITVWEPPWDFSGWEVSEGFWERWGWMLRGVEEEVLRATNRWRTGRGESGLRFERRAWGRPARGII